MKKEKIKNIVLIMIVAVISSTVTSFATSNYLFDSIDVKYDNSNGVQAETVQGAIDELYSCASDYSGIDTRLSSVENHFVASDNGFELGNDIAVTDRGYYIKDSLGNIRSGFLYNNNNTQTNIISYDSTGTWGNFGTLNLWGNPVTINGTSIGDLIKIKSIHVPCSSMSKNMSLASYVTIDQGYKFLAWQTTGTSDGWISSFPIYLALPNTINGSPWWNGDLNNTQYVNFFYFEIIS